MTEYHWPSLSTEELIRLNQHSADPLVQELCKRLAALLDDGK